MKTTNLILTLLITFGLFFSGLTTETSFAKSNKENKKTESKKTKNKTADTKKSKKQKKSTKQLPSPKSISINKASKKELMTVPGIGPKTADAIIAHRKGKSFSSINDLMQVKGIGEKTLLKMKPYLKK